MTRQRLSAVLVALIGMLVSVAYSQIQNRPKGEKYALLIGVREYDPVEITSLRYPEDDVTELAEVLKGQGYRPGNVLLMTQAVGAKRARFLPTSTNIRKELPLILKDLTADDSILVAFAGHGIEFKGEPTSWFCPADAKLSDTTTLVSLNDVVAQMGKCNAGVKVLLVDACRAEPRSRNSRTPPESITRPQPVTPPGGMAAFFSCSSGQEALEHEELKHGVFFHFVIQGLRGQAADAKGEITLPDLEKYVKREVRDYVRDKFGVRQTPELHNKSVGLITLASRDSGGGVIPPPPPPGDKSITNSIGMSLVLVPAGKFKMGSPTSEADRGTDEEQHDVEITKPFYMGKFEVTQAEYEKVIGSNPSNFKGGDLPVETVRWEDAVAFCQKLSERAEEKRAGRVYRLPTEAEWEYACRAGTTTPFHYGTSLSATQANFDGNYPYGGAAKGEYRQKTTKVGTFAPNKLGLHDMHGNVWEWCQDWYDEKFYSRSPGRDPVNEQMNAARVLRGGSSDYHGHLCRAANRGWNAPGIRLNYPGLRVVVSAASRTP